jgi:hypothetical protein
MFGRGTVEGNEEEIVREKAGNRWLKPVVGGDLPRDYLNPCHRNKDFDPSNIFLVII